MELSYNPQKTMCMFVGPRKWRILNTCEPTLYGIELKWVNEYRYLGVLLTSDFKDNRDIERQIRLIYCRGNQIIRKFSKCSTYVKTQLFRSFISCMYCSPLWCSYTKETYTRLQVAYNYVFRRLLGFSKRCSMSSQFVSHNVPSFKENIRMSTTSFRGRTMTCANNIISDIISSPYFIYSSPLYSRWSTNIFTYM